MNRVEITTMGPVMENLCQVTIADEHANDTFYIDQADVEAALTQEGKAGILDLVCANCGSGYDILEAAVSNRSPVSLDNEDVTKDELAKALANALSPSP